MTQTTASRLDPILWQADEPERTVDTVTAALADTGLARIGGFPAAASSFMDLLGEFGEPLGYYGGDSGTHPDNSAIWRIRYEPASAARGETHAVDGPLLPHSSQSLREPRPRWFSMLMVDCGWQDAPFGQNGESVFASWRAAFRRLRKTPGLAYDSLVQTLLGEVPYPDGSTRSVAYRLDDARLFDDLGVRLKSDLLQFLERDWPHLPATAAVRHLADSASAVALEVPLTSNDLVILDNDRWAHGRLSVTGRRTDPDGVTQLNPRELWSVTVA